MSAQSTKEFLRPAKAAAFCDLSKSTIDRMLRAKTLTRHKQGTATLIEVAELRRVLKSQAETSGG